MLNASDLLRTSKLARELADKRAAEPLPPAPIYVPEFTAFQLDHMPPDERLRAIKRGWKRRHRAK